MLNGAPFASCFPYFRSGVSPPEDYQYVCEIKLRQGIQIPRVVAKFSAAASAHSKYTSRGEDERQGGIGGGGEEV